MKGSICAVATAILLSSQFFSVSPAAAEMWRCQKNDGTPPMFTETPAFGDDVKCEPVKGTSYTRSPNWRTATPGSASVSSKPAKPVAPVASKPAKVKTSGSSSSRRPSSTAISPRH